jgi:ABC-type sugar transport system substrate-binding protein/anti-anti-sigma regulatory factor/putative methionine-R-sulfoxide reductase with GAF domain
MRRIRIQEIPLPMHVGISVSATLQQIVRSTIAYLPEAERASILVRDGQQLIYRAAVGYDLDHLRSWQIRFNGQSDLALDVSTYRAIDWYATHMPPELRSDVQPLDDATVVAVPIVTGGQLIGSLNVERTTAAPPTADQQVLLHLLAENIARVLERHWLFEELTRSTEEVRLLADVLDAVGSSSRLEEVIHTVGYGIKNALPYKRWHTVRLALLSAQQQQLHTYEILGPRMNPFWSNIGKGALTAGRDLGIEVEFVLGGDSGAGSQVEIIDAAIQAGVQGIAVAAVNPVAVEAAIRRAREAGIPVVAYDVPPVPDSQALLYIGTDNLSAGRLAGQMLARLLPEGGLVGIGTESLQQINAIQRLDGFQLAIADTSIQLLQPCVDNHDAALGQRLASETLAEHPNLAGVFGITAAATPNWGAAITAAGKAGQIKVVGFDVVADTTSMLKAGLVDVAIAQRENDMGYRSVEILCQMVVNGVEQTLAHMPDSRFIDTGVDAVTLEGTPWSISLAEYLKSTTGRQSADREQQDAVARHGKPIKILVIAIAEKAELSTAEKNVAFQPNSWARQVITSGQSLVIDPFAAEYANFPEAIAARERNMRTIVGVPLTDRGEVVGLLSLESQMAEACTPADLVLIERIANAGAVVIANARLFDQVAERTSELERSYRRQEIMLQTINELSSPVAPIITGILVMPLIGSIDSQRANRFMETLLCEISARQAQVVLIDITGVSVVDTSVANHILQAGQAAKLLGAEVVLVGITPVVAQTMVQLGMQMQDLVSRSDLASGFAYALKRMRARIVYN